MLKYLKLFACLVLGICMISGTAYAANLVGTTASETINGTNNADVIDATQGGADAVNGKDGKDAINVNDGVADDNVNCGAGNNDSATVDQGDITSNCDGNVTRIPIPPTPTGSCLSGETDVTKQGLVPNDNKDDGVALQSLVNSSPSGTTLCFPQGKYDLADEVEVYQKVINFKGQTGAVLRRQIGSGSHSLLWLSRMSGGSVTGFDIDGQSADEATSAVSQMIWVMSSDNLNISNNTFHDIRGDGVSLAYYYNETASNQHCSNFNKVDNNTFTNHNEGREAIFHVCGDSNHIGGNKVYEWSQSYESRQGPGGIDVESDFSYNYHTNLVVENNYVRNNSSITNWSGIHMAITWYGPSTHVANNIFRNNEITGNFNEGIGASANSPDYNTFSSNNIHDIGPAAEGGVKNDGPNHYANNTIKNINGGTGECIHNWYLSTPYQDTGGNYSGCV